MGNVLAFWTRLSVLGFNILICLPMRSPAICRYWLHCLCGVYSLTMKRNSVYGTLVVAASRAVPPVVSLLQLATRPNGHGRILFAVDVQLWQILRSYAIADFPFNDYAAANISCAASLQKA